MLTFCEDCGERNILDPCKLKENHNKFRCQVCNFQNTYQGVKKASPSGDQRIDVSSLASGPPAKRFKRNTHSSPHNKVFQNLQADDLILGGFIYHFSENILACDVPADLDENFLCQIGNAFAVCCRYSHNLFPGAGEKTIVMEGLTAVCRNITMSSILVVLTSSHPSPPELSATLNQALNSLQVFI